MARPWRIQFPGALYHVMTRGNNRQKIFRERDDLLDCLDRLGLAASGFNLEILAFCLMPNHYHLFLRTPEPNLSAAMHWINATYTQRFHLRHRTGGHLLQGRYKSVLVAEETHWLHLSAYIHLNPVRARLADDPAQYEWSSFRDYTRSRRRFAWLRPDHVLARFGDTDAARRRNYRGQVLALSGRPPSFWEEMRNAVFLGTEEQWEAIRKKHPPLGDQRTAPDFQISARPPLDFDRELSRVARAFEVEPDDILLGKRKAHARLALYYHMVLHCGQSESHLAGRLGVSPMAVSLGIKRLKEKIDKDDLIHQRIKELMFNV